MKIKAIFLSPGHDFKGRKGQGRLEHGIQRIDSVECVARSGLVGDRYFDYKENFKGQVTFFDWAVYQKIREKFDCSDLDPAAFRRNIMTVGVDLNTLIGQRFTLQGIEFEGSEECSPCSWMDEVVAPGAHEALKGFGGLRARILKSGTLAVAA